MHSATLVLTGLAALAAAAPSMAVGDRLDGELHMFKRGAPLSARDIELAEMHQVNLTEMFKHSVIKRDDGDDIHFWVDNSFEEVEGPQEKIDQDNGLEKRQQRPPWVGNHYSSTTQRQCPTSYSVNDATRSTSPFSGGVLAMARWGEGRYGRFYHQNTDWRNLVVCGSNSGQHTNARFSAKISWMCGPTDYVGCHDYSFFGTRDIGWRARQVYDRFTQSYSGRERAQGYGRAACYAWSSWTRGTTGWDWEIANSQTRL